MKKVLAIMLASVTTVSILLSGCGTQKTSLEAPTAATKAAVEKTEATAPAEKTHVRFMYWNKQESLQTLVNLINEKLPNIDFEFQFVDTKSYDTVIKTQLAAGEGPELMSGGSETDVRAGYVMDLTNQPFISKYTPSVMSELSINGKIYCIPGPSWFGGYFYNKDIFAKHNLTIPKTWDEFIKTCDTLKKAGIKPLATPGKNANYLMHYALSFVTPEFLRQQEGMSWDADYKKGTVKMEGTFDKYMDKWSEIVKLGFVTKEDLGKDYDQCVDEFASGKAAMFDSGPWDVETLKKKNPDLKIDMMPFVGNKGDTGWLFGGPGIKFAINSKAKNPDAVLSILELISTPEGQKAYWQDNKGGSSYLKGVEFEMPAEYDGCKQVFAEGHIYAPFSQWNSGVYEEFGKQLQEYLGGAATLSDVLKAADKKNAEIIEKLK